MVVDGTDDAVVDAVVDNMFKTVDEAGKALEVDVSAKRCDVEDFVSPSLSSFSSFPYPSSSFSYHYHLNHLNHCQNHCQNHRPIQYPIGCNIGAVRYKNEEV